MKDNLGSSDVDRVLRARAEVERTFIIVTKAIQKNGRVPISPGRLAAFKKELYSRIARLEQTPACEMSSDVADPEAVELERLLSLLIEETMTLIAACESAHGSGRSRQESDPLG